MHSDVRRLFDAAFYLAARTRLKTVLDSPEFAQRLATRARLQREAKPKSLESLLPQVPGALQFAAVTSFGPERAAQILDRVPSSAHNRPDSVETELFTALGDAIIDSAALVLPPEAIDLGNEFGRVDGEAQRVILRRLFDLFSTKRNASETPTPWRSRDDAYVADLGQQRISRVIPRQFGKWHRHGNPNCLGKAELIYGWAKRFGVDCFGIMPVETRGEFVTRNVEQVARVMIEHSLKVGTQLSPGFIEYAARAIEQAYFDGEIPSAPHFGAALRLKDGSWFLIDPHQAVIGPLSSETWSFTMEHLVWQRQSFSEVVPGLSYFGNDPYEGKDAVLDAASVVDEWTVAGHELHLRLSAVADGAAQDRFLALAGSKAINFLARKLGIPELGMTLESVITSGIFPKGISETFGVRLWKQPAKPELLEGEDKERAEKALLIINALSTGKFLASIRQSREVFTGRTAEILDRAVREIPSYCLIAGLDLFCRKLSKVVHPTMEFFVPATRVGAEVVGHINALSVQSEEVVRSVAAAAPSTLSLLALAMQPLRTNDAMSLDAKYAALALDQLPVKQPVVERGLRLLAELQAQSTQSQGV